MKVSNNIDRPDWDTYFMTLCLVGCQRSVDQNTKHGCVVVSQDHTILSIGYNSPPRGMNDALVPQDKTKYSIMAHAESNAISNAAKHGIPLNNSVFYISGFPCENCFRSIINVGASKVVYGPIGSNCVTEETKEIVEYLNEGAKIPILEYSCDDMVRLWLNKSINYLDKKTKNVKTSV